jgi:hypothetical protein
MVAFPWFVHVFNSSDVRNAGMRGDTQYCGKVTNGLLTAIGEQW